MNRVEEILSKHLADHAINGNVTDGATEITLEFTKWKDNNYVYQKSIGKYAEKVEGKWSFFTSEQLFNEWNNLNK